MFPTATYGHGFTICCVFCGIVKEKELLIGVLHVSETTTSSLIYSIESFFQKYGLSLKEVIGQGYVGASNMLVEQYI